MVEIVFPESAKCLLAVAFRTGLRMGTVIRTLKFEQLYRSPDNLSNSGKFGSVPVLEMNHTWSFNNILGLVE